EALDLRPAHEELHADPGAEREAGDPAGAGLGIERLRPVEGGGGIRQLALAVIEAALAASDAAKVEAHHRKVPGGEGIVEVVDDLVVHRAAELRMWMQHDRDGGILLACRVVPTLDPTSRTGKDDFGHGPPRNANGAAAAAANTLLTARLTR